MEVRDKKPVMNGIISYLWCIKRLLSAQGSDILASIVENHDDLGRLHDDCYIPQHWPIHSVSNDKFRHHNNCSAYIDWNNEYFQFVWCLSMLLASPEATFQLGQKWPRVRDEGRFQFQRTFNILLLPMKGAENRQDRKTRRQWHINFLWLENTSFSSSWHSCGYLANGYVWTKTDDWLKGNLYINYHSHQQYFIKPSPCTANWPVW